MKKVFNKRLIVFLCLLLVAAGAAFGWYWKKMKLSAKSTTQGNGSKAAFDSDWQGKEQVVQRALLCRIFPDITCVLNGLQTVLCADSESTTYQIVLDDQFERPASISVDYQGEDPLKLYRVKPSGEFIGFWEIKSGTQSFPIEKDDDSLYLVVPKNFDSVLNLTYPQTVAGGAYQGKYLSVIGDSLSSYVGYVSPYCCGAYTEDLIASVRDMWWYEMARLTGMNVCSINASGGSGVTEVPDPLHTGNGERCTQLSSLGRDPDVIFVLLGLNDIFKQVDLDVLKSEYTQMVDRIQQTYPEAELLLCNYFELPGDYKPFVYDLNRMISEIAEEQGLRLLDLCSSNISYEEPEKRYVDFDPVSGAGVHPNSVGQIMLGTTAASLLTGQN